MTGSQVILGVALLSFPIAGTLSQDLQHLSEARLILREAGKLVPQMEEVEQPSAASNIAGQQVRAGDLAGALETVRSVKQERGSGPPLGLGYHGLAWALSHRGAWQAAVHLIRDLPDGDSKAIDYLGIVYELAAQKDFEHALSAARMIQTIPHAVSRFADSLVEISNQQFKAGDRGAAGATLREAFDAVERAQKDAGQPGFNAAQWYAWTVRSLASAGNSEAASLAMGQLYSVATQEKRSPQDWGLLKLVTASQARLGDFAAALLSAGQLPAGEHRDAALLSIATEMAAQGDTAGAQRIAGEVPAKSWSNAEIGDLANAFASSGDSVGALETLKRIQAPEDRAYALALLALQLVLQPAERKNGFAWLTAVLAMEDALSGGDAVNPFVFEAIAVMRGTLGDLSGALQIIDSLKDANKVWPLWNITKQLVAAGKKNEALTLARAQEAPRARGFALLGTATALLEQVEADSNHK